MIFTRKHQEVYGNTIQIITIQLITALGNNNSITCFPANNNSTSFKFKQRITGHTENDGAKEVEIKVILKYLNNFRRVLEMLLN